jgi:hypothetical protein
MIFSLKFQHVCALAGAIKRLIQELNFRFPSHAIMDALEIVYPQYWFEPNLM